MVTRVFKYSVEPSTDPSEAGPAAAEGDKQKSKLQLFGNRMSSPSIPPTPASATATPHSIRQSQHAQDAGPIPSPGSPSHPPPLHPPHPHSPLPAWLPPAEALATLLATALTLTARYFIRRRPNGIIGLQKAVVAQASNRNGQLDTIQESLHLLRTEMTTLSGKVGQMHVHVTSGQALGKAGEVGSRNGHRGVLAELAKMRSRMDAGQFGGPKG